MGPAFEVRGWARAGHSPQDCVRAASINAANGGSRRPRARRPIRIEFCAADILQRCSTTGDVPSESAVPPPRPPAQRHVSQVSRRTSSARRPGSSAAQRAEGVAPLPESAMRRGRSRALDRIAEAASAKGTWRRASGPDCGARLDHDRRSSCGCVAGLLDEPTSRRLRRGGRGRARGLRERMPADARATAVDMAPTFGWCVGAAGLPRVGFGS